jgi:hypothetical protein
MSALNRSPVQTVPTSNRSAWARSRDHESWQPTTTQRNNPERPECAPETLPNDADVTSRRKSIKTAWSIRERDARRRQALRKQEDLLVLLAGSELEELVRDAVADGEQPVVLPEVAALQTS